MHFKSYFLKFRRQYKVLCCLLANLQPSCEIGVFSVAIFRKVLYRKWPPLALSLSQYHTLFVDITFVRMKIPLSSTVQEVHIAITQYPGVPPLPK